MEVNLVLEPRMITDETRMDNRMCSICFHILQVELGSRVTHGLIREYPCSSVAEKGI
jgi:hypothetical protein